VWGAEGGWEEKKGTVRKKYTGVIDGLTRVSSQSWVENANRREKNIMVGGGGGGD